MSTNNTLEILRANYPGQVLINFKKSSFALGISTDTLRSGICRKTIPLKTIKQGKRRLVHINDLAVYIDELSSRTQAPKKRGRPRNTPTLNIVGGAK